MQKMQMQGGKTNEENKKLVKHIFNKEIEAD